MSEERFWNTDEYTSTAKFAVHDGAMTMRQAGRIFRLDPARPRWRTSTITLFLLSESRTIHTSLTSSITTSQG